MPARLFWTINLLSMLVLNLFTQESRRSIYTDLASGKCQTIKLDKESGSSVQRCAGVEGYKLLVLDDDSRQSVTLVAPNGKEHPLKFWEVITGHFSSIGQKAEWRVVEKNGKSVPVGLIVRVNAAENPDAPNQITSYLAVAKITPAETCVTDKIQPGAKANEVARIAADAAVDKPCLKGLGE
jgi:hypothetical protein